MKTVRIPLVLATALTLAATSVRSGDGHNLIENGKFEIAEANGHPQGWIVSHPNFLKQNETEVELLSEGDTTFYRVTKRAATAPGIGRQEIDIPENAESLRVAIRMRGKGIVRGQAGWMLPGLAVTYLYEGQEEGKPGSLDKWPVVPPGDSEWEDYEAIIPVRDGARRADISLIGQGWTGTADFTGVEVEIVE